MKMLCDILEVIQVITRFALLLNGRIFNFRNEKEFLYNLIVISGVRGINGADGTLIVK